MGREAKAKELRRQQREQAVVPESGQWLVQQQFEQSQVQISPFPSGSELEHYERIVPGAAARILEMGIQEQQHRLRLENTELDARIALANRYAALNDRYATLNERFLNRGQGFAFVIVLLAFVLAGAMVWWFQASWNATVLFGSVVASLVTAFAISRRRTTPDGQAPADRQAEQPRS